MLVFLLRLKARRLSPTLCATDRRKACAKVDISRLRVAQVKRLNLFALDALKDIALEISWAAEKAIL